MFKFYKIFMKVWSNIYILTGVVKYMCEEMGFSEDRIRNGLEKMKKAKSKGCQVRNYKVILRRVATRSGVLKLKKSQESFLDLK